MKVPVVSIQDSALEAIDRLMSDDDCQDWEAEFAFHPTTFNDREKKMQEKLATVYRFCHCAVTSNSCYQVHENWRKEMLESLTQAVGDSSESIGAK